MLDRACALFRFVFSLAIKLRMPKYIAKTYQGLEETLSQELVDLGATDVTLSKRAVLFDCSQEVLYKANYLCRTALRISKILNEFEISKEEELYDRVYEMPWEKIFPVDAVFTVDSSSLESVFSQSRFASHYAKIAILDRFRRVLGQKPSVDSEYYTIRVEVFVRKNHCEILLDASGMALNHRGYRKPASEAFNEVLASGLLKLGGWNPDTDLYVPFCGNGIVALEAAMQAMNMPAGYYRKGFSFEYWNDFDPKLWKEVKAEAIDAIHDPEGTVWASDSDPMIVGTTEEFLKKIRMHQDVNLSLTDFMRGKRPEGLDDLSNLTLCVPMPVMVRGVEFSATSFYSELGKVLKENYSGCTAMIYTIRESDLRDSLMLTPEKEYELREGLKPAFLNICRIR